MPDKEISRQSRPVSPTNQVHTASTASPILVAHEAGVTPDASAVHDPRAWLEHFPASKRSAVANWHHFAVRGGAHTPAQVSRQVVRTVQQRLASAPDPETTTHLTRVLEVLRTEQAGALAYAQHVLDYEALPDDARQRVKAERAIHYRRETMVGKLATPAQLAFLHALGDSGPPPANRAEAHARIDALLRRREVS
jgi:hypothetical protein